MGIDLKSKGVHSRKEIPPESAYLVPLELGETVKSGYPRRFAIDLRFRLVGANQQELEEIGRSTGKFYASLSELVSELSLSACWS